MRFRTFSYHTSLIQAHGATQFVASGASFAELKERLGDSSSAAAILYLHPTGQEAKIVEEMPQIEIH